MSVENHQGFRLATLPILAITLRNIVRDGHLQSQWVVGWVLDLPGPICAGHGLEERSVSGESPWKPRESCVMLHSLTHCLTGRVEDCPNLSCSFLGPCHSAHDSRVGDR